MAAVRFPPRTSLPAPVIAAVIAILATRLFNLLMVILHPDGNHSAELLFRLSPLPGYLLIFIGAVYCFCLRSAVHWRYCEAAFGDGAGLSAASAYWWY